MKLLLSVLYEPLRIVKGGILFAIMICFGVATI